MISEIGIFCRRYKLSPRQSSVVHQLIIYSDSVDVIAERMGLSKNTIHNHFKEIFLRTDTHSKAAILRKFIFSLAELS